MFEWMDPGIFFSQDPGYGTWAKYLHKASLPNQPAKKGPTSLAVQSLSLALLLFGRCIFLHCFVALLHERANFFIRRRARVSSFRRQRPRVQLQLQRGATLPLTPPAPVPLYLGPHRCKLQTRTATAPFPPLLRSSRTAASKSTPTASEA